MKYSYDFTIVGGGINGLLLAKELLAVSNSIAIIDRSHIGRESSWAGGGILLPLYPWRQPAAVSTLALHGINKYPALSKQLKEATGIDPEWLDCGLFISRNPDIDDAIAWCRQHGVRFQQSDDLFDDIVHYCPEHALWLPEVAQARNPRLVKSVQSYLANAGVHFFEETEITGLQCTHNQAIGITSATDRFSSAKLILTAGAWTKQLITRFFDATRSPWDIHPVKGQMLLYETEPGTLPCMILDHDRYLIPRRDGKILAGSTVERTGFDKSLSNAAEQDLREFAVNIFPPLRHAPLLTHWAGLRPGSPQGVPIIGRHPEIENLFISAGHFRNGLVMAPASAELLADIILDRPACVNASPYQLTVE